MNMVDNSVSTMGTPLCQFVRPVSNATFVSMLHSLLQTLHCKVTQFRLNSQNLVLICTYKYVTCII